ncbi:CHAT domain-containing protein [Baaleninema simplex]|uniref:CHAT domain-containing protein n=1 Tax=Baaleninema simplex TaxID=2862350 RepID=UPI00034AA4AA|nr:CHAT domain-containing protein [Baaleninema simplex]
MRSEKARYWTDLTRFRASLARLGFSRLGVSSVLLALLGHWTFPQVSLSQSVVPADDGTGTQVTPVGNRYDIDGGSLSGDGDNLFHSFQQLDLDAGETANFLTSPEIQNVFGRIVGARTSQINGILQLTGSSANLFLLNPSGFLFGPQAQLNLPASFFATTASGIGFDGGWFEAVGTPDYTALVGTPNGFRFDGSGTIVSEADLSVSSGQTLGLLGGTVTATNRLSAGTLVVTAVSEGNRLRLSQPGFLLSLEIPASVSSVTPLQLPALLTGGETATLREVRVTAESVRVAGGTVEVEASTIRVSGDLSVVGETVRLRDRPSTPLILEAGETLQLWGDRTLDILALNHLETPPVVSGGDLVLLGNGIVSTDSHFRSGGDFRVLGNGRLQSLFDPIILAVGDVSFGDYTGAALKIEAGGSISGGNITITSPDTSLSGGFPNDPDLDVLTTLPSLILRAGVAVSDPTGASPGFTLSDSPTTPGTIAVGDIDTATNQVEGGVVVLEAPGSISLGNVNTAGLEAGGDIAIASQEAVTAGTLFSGGGDITIFSDNAVTADDLIATGLEGGNIEISARTRLSLGNVDAEGLVGNGGAIVLSSLEDAEIDSIDARGAVSGGAIDLKHRQLRVSDFVSTGIVGGDTSSIAGGSIRVELTDDTAPFIVGDSTTNGTQGSLTADANAIDPTFVAPPGTVRQGDITIVTPSRPDTPTRRDPANTTDAEDDIERLQRIPDKPLREILWVAMSEIFDPEIRYTRDYTEYLGLEPRPEVSLAKTREILARIERQTGVKPALVYAQFVPGRLEATPQKQGLLNLDRLAVREVLEILVVTASEPPVRVVLPEATRERVEAVSLAFRGNLTNPRLRRGDRYLTQAKQLYEWLIRPLEAVLSDRDIENLTFVMPEGLRTLPVAALFDGDGFLIESYSVGLMPSLSLTNTEYADIRDTQVLAMGSAQFDPETALSPLPAVPVEVTTIAERLWPGAAFLNEAFTLENLRSQREQTPYGIVHLATHGEFVEGEAENSYIQLWDTKLRLDRLRQLNWSRPPVELLVLSACRTAVGSEEAELGFAGLAVAAGVKTALGSFWYVSDDGTLGLMTEFYAQLKTTPIKAEALRQTQLAMLREEVRVENGELVTLGGTVSLPEAIVQRVSDKSFAHPYYWSAFILVGSPW